MQQYKRLFSTAEHITLLDPHNFSYHTQSHYIISNDHLCFTIQKKLGAIIAFNDLKKMFVQRNQSQCSYFFMFHSVWGQFPLFEFLYLLQHSSLINLALKQGQRLTTTRKCPTASVGKIMFKNVLMKQFSRHLLSSDASSLDSSRPASRLVTNQQSGKIVMSGT